MKRALALVGACAILALPAFAQTPQGGTAQNPPAQTTPAQPAPATPAPAPNTPPPAASSSATQNTASTADFVNNAAIAGLFEIESSQLALRKHVRADRAFARRMIRDHRRIGAQLRRTVRANRIKVQIPTKLDDQHQKMLDQLKQESGATFEKDYAQMQQQGHQQAVSLFQSYSQDGDNAALKRLATKTLPVLKMHLAMANKLQS
jgi:putative membrane protein